MRDAEPAAQRVADGVADAKTGAGHGGPGQMRRQQHLGPRLPVRAVGHGVRQVGRDHPHDLQGDAVRPRVGAPGQVRLQGVRERVHPGRGGAGGRQAQGQVRVEDRGGRQRAGVADVELAACLRVGHHPERVRLRAGPGGGGHGDQGQRGAGERAAVVEVAAPLRVDRGQRDALGGVDHRAAAHRDHRHRGAAGGERSHLPGAGRHVLGRRVGVHAGEHRSGQAVGGERGLGGGHDRGARQRRVGDQGHRLAAGAPDDSGQRADGARAEMRGRQGRVQDPGACEWLGHGHSCDAARLGGVAVRRGAVLPAA